MMIILIGSRSQKLIINGIDCDHMFEVDQVIPHNFRPVVPSDSFVHFEGVNMELCDFVVHNVHEEGNSELL